MTKRLRADDDDMRRSQGDSYFAVHCGLFGDDIYRRPVVCLTRAEALHYIVLIFNALRATMTSKIDLQDHTILVLPFTPSLLRDPSPLYSPILDVLPRSSKKSFTVFFSTPAGSISSEQSAIQSISGVGSNQEQLYSLLRRTPQESFKALQSFLGHIYTALWTAQWKCGNVLLDVEVHFEGESGKLGDKLLRGKDDEEEYQLIKVEGGELLCTGCLVDEGSD